MPTVCFTKYNNILKYMKRVLVRKLSAVTLASLIIVGLLVVRPVRAAYYEPAANPLSYIWTYNPVVMYWSSVFKPLEIYKNPPQFSSTYVPMNTSRALNTPTHTYVASSVKPLNQATHSYTAVEAKPINVPTHEYTTLTNNTINVATHTYEPLQKEPINQATHQYVAQNSDPINVPTHEYTDVTKKAINVPVQTYEAWNSKSINIPTHTYVDYVAPVTNIATQTYTSFTKKAVNIPTHVYSSFSGRKIQATNTYSSWGTNGPTNFGSEAEPLTVRRATNSPLPSVFADSYGTSSNSVSSSSRGQYSFDFDSDTLKSTLPTVSVPAQNTAVRSVTANGIDVGDTSAESLAAPLKRSDLARIVWSVFKKRQQAGGSQVTTSQLPIIGDVKNTNALYQTFVEVAARGLMYMPSSKVEHGVLVYAEAKPSDTAPAAQILQALYTSLGKTPSAKAVYTYTDIKADDWYAPFMYEAHAKQLLRPSCTQNKCTSGAFGSLTKQEVLGILDALLRS